MFEGEVLGGWIGLPTPCGSAVTFTPLRGGKTESPSPGPRGDDCLVLEPLAMNLLWISSTSQFPKWLSHVAGAQSHCFRFLSVFVVSYSLFQRRQVSPRYHQEQRTTQMPLSPHNPNPVESNVLVSASVTPLVIPPVGIAGNSYLMMKKA